MNPYSAENIKILNSFKRKVDGQALESYENLRQAPYASCHSL